MDTLVISPETAPAPSIHAGKGRGCPVASALLMNLSCLVSTDPRSQETQSVPETNCTFFSLKLYRDKGFRVPNPNTQVLGGCQPGAGDIWRQGHCSLYKDTKDSTGIYTKHPFCCENPAATTGSGLERTYPCQTFLQGILAACPSQHSITFTLAVLRVLRTNSPALPTLPDPMVHGHHQLSPAGDPKQPGLCLSLLIGRETEAQGWRRPDPRPQKAYTGH